MSDITQNDLPPINEIDEFTANIPELQTDTRVLAGAGGPANFQAQALANRTKYLKRVLDSVSQELIEIDQSIVATQQSADASMKKSANGSDIANPATFRANIGLGSAATHDVQTSSTDATPNRILKMAANGQGSFGLGGSGAEINLSGADFLSWCRNSAAGSRFFRNNGEDALYTKRYSAGIFAKSGDTWGAITFGPSPTAGSSAGVRATAGTAAGTQTESYEFWTDKNLVKQSAAWSRAADGEVLVAGFAGGIGQDRSAVMPSATLASDFRINGAWYAQVNQQSDVPGNGHLFNVFSNPSRNYGLQFWADYRNSQVNFKARSIDNNVVGDWRTYSFIDVAQTITAVKTVQVNEAAMLFRPSSEIGAYYIMGRKFDNTNEWYIGKPSSTNRHITFHGYNGNNGLRLTESGPVELYGVGRITYNGAELINDSSNQTISGTKTFAGGVVRQGDYPNISLISNRVAAGTVGRQVVIEQDGIAQNMYFMRNNAVNNTGRAVIYLPMAANGNILVTGNNAVADSGGFWKTASPVINIYADGSFTATDEAAGVGVERISEGVYKITGCQGMHPDAAWNGIDGGVSNPKCRNDKALLWNNYEVDDDGSVTVYTFHRVHPDAMQFAQNRLTLDKEPFDEKKGHTPDMEWPDQTPIDVPKGMFIQVRVNMPERAEPKPSVMSSNVYCNTISPAK
ncbi:hypothetical protein [Pectobacterium polaris]|uniref:phage tail fiber protein n=1 Tax=Pectobacterium polaris TaxID=2042057 RepID=UPI0024062A0D|nr:hypothetical protein [Pectobacterium polaris]MDG0802704.1 hypothetical protein [Pectobacterium polaris]